MSLSFFSDTPSYHLGDAQLEKELAEKPPPKLHPHWTTSARYTRIRILNRDDIEATYPLIAAYVQDPTLALSIKEMVVDPDAWPLRWDGYHDELNEPAKPVYENAHAVIEAFVRGLGLGGATTDSMIDALRWKKDHLLGRKPDMPCTFPQHNRMYADVAIVLLLSLAQNLKTLHMGRIGGDSLWAYLVHNNYGRLPTLSLQKLERVHHIALSRDGDDRMYDDLDPITYLRVFHRLPALETVTMDGIMEPQDYVPFYPPRTASFKDLRITHVDISSITLAAVIRLPRALEKFALTLGGLWHPKFGFPCVYYKTVGKALREHKTTLRELDLDLGNIGAGCNPEEEELPESDDVEEEDDDSDVSDEYWYFIDEWYNIDLADSTGPRWPHQLPNGDDGLFGTGVGSLRSFTALRRLSIDLHVLLGWCNPPFHLIDALPKGLEVLRLYDYQPGRDEFIDKDIQELLRVKEERFPDLREIEGLKEKIEVMDTRCSNRAEEELWKRPKRDVDWVRVSEL
ncbi:hypothetical protein F5X68DRAFT_28845 [Plectosphaerella plurivora]|uniref:Uncharacterized protein n=1 Tax=Plectosphaerella plurivora TaxID=936078 RepID=A0A9P8VL35_9PEZI|nr:hypothetical protein F5X68DRAFT_28845 [Plectosphaerella plurivora]